MASVLKRKRGPVEAVESKKRARSTAGAQVPILELDLKTVEWDATFGRHVAPNRLTTTNELNGEANYGSEDPNSLRSNDFEDLVKQGRAAKVENKIRRAESLPSKESTWKISDPIGGRMIDIDPVFTEDEKFLIVARGTNIQVYSTSNSLLNRTISLSVDNNQNPIAQVVAYILSPTDSNIIWVACSNGSVFKVDWPSGEGADRSWKTSSSSITHMTAASLNSAEQRRDIVFTTERHEGGWRISAHELSVLGKSLTTQSRTIYTSPRPIQMIKATRDGSVLVGASDERVLLGALRNIDFGTVDRIRYEFRIFESTDFISSLNVRVSKRNLVSGIRTSKSEKTDVVDVVVGDVKGAIFVHNDLLRNLIRSQNPSAGGQGSINMIPRKLHWHRKAVNSVKWSLDGNYIISGGSETVLVLWQLDTGRQQYLPHLSATIQNIVISPTGTSYAIHLSDNSTMILSTTELIPTANISGIQAHVTGARLLPGSRVQRIDNTTPGSALVPRTRAVINPVTPQWLLLAVGDDQEFTAASPSAPFLQTFDIASNHNVSRQAMTRTNVTNKNITPGAYRIAEPLISQMQISHDGAWLVTVDEWLPPRQDIEFLAHGNLNPEDEQRRRREVYLKFWQWNKSDENWGLVSRIDAPHAMAAANCGAGRVLALATDSSSLTFSTLGEDSVILIWRPRIRKRDGLAVRGQDGEGLYNWTCHLRIALDTGGLDDDTISSRSQTPQHGCLSFSDDGSILAVAVSGREDGLIHFVDPFTGTIRSSRPMLYKGGLISMAFLGQYLITLSDELCTYDVVLDKHIYGITLGDATSLSLQEKAEMMHLAVDRTSRTFAVALPCTTGHQPQKKSGGRAPMDYSEIAVFDPKYPNPLYTKSLSSLVTALLPAISSAGFVIVDASAQIATISPKASQTLTSLAKPMVDLRLDIRAEEEIAEPVVDLMQLVDEAEAEEEQEDGQDNLAAEIAIASNAAPSDADLEDDDLTVVTQHQLTQALDLGPSFTLPPVEEMFYRVAGLFNGKSKQVAV